MFNIHKPGLAIGLLTLALSVGAETPTTFTNQAQNPDDPILIEGANVVVRKSDFEIEILNVPPGQRMDFKTNLTRIQHLLERVFQNKVLVAEAKKNDFDKDPKVAAELKYLLETRLASLYMNKLIDEVRLPDLEPRLKETYKLSVDKYVEPERIRASHILISNKQHTVEEARKLAEEVRQKALAGESFKELALNYSEDPSAKNNNGDLGFFPATQMVAPFSKAAFALKTPGEISPVVETNFGFHVIRLESRMPPRTPSYDELRPKFLEDAAREFRAQEMNTYLGRLMAKENPKANDAEVEKLQFKFDPRALIESAKQAPK